MKRQTRAMLAAGYDEQQVRDYLNRIYKFAKSTRE